MYATNIFAVVNLQMSGSNTFVCVSGTYYMDNWNVTKARLKEKFAKLIGDDLMATPDKPSKLAERLEKRLGKTKAAILKFLSE